MGIKMPEAYFATTRQIITVKQAQRMGLKTLSGRISCAEKDCSARLRFVDTYVKGEERETPVAAHFSLISSITSPHSEDCRYNLDAQVRIAAREAPNLLYSLRNGTHEFRLHVLSDVLQNKMVPNDASGSAPNANDSRPTSVEYQTQGSLSAYLSTANRIAVLAARVEDNEDLARRIKLRFRDEAIPWTDFYFDEENFLRCFRYVRQRSYQPICVTGEIKAIEEPNGTRKFKTIRLKPPRRDNTSDLLDIPIVHLNFDPELMYLASNLSVGDRVVVYGHALASAKTKGKITFQNITVWIRARGQIGVVSR